MYGSDNDREEASPENSRNSSDSVRSSSTAKSIDIFHRSIEEESPSQTKPIKTKSMTQKRESRSKFFAAPTQSSETVNSTSSNLNEEVNSISDDSCLLSNPGDCNIVNKVNEVIVEGIAPEIKVECPSPEKFQKEVNFFDSDTVPSDCEGQKTTYRRRCASETRTTAL